MKIERYHLENTLLRYFRASTAMLGVIETKIFSSESSPGFCFPSIYKTDSSVALAARESVIKVNISKTKILQSKKEIR